MRFIALHDPEVIARRLGSATELNLYQLGDLDPFFWPYTTWYGDDQSDETALLYTGSSPPTLLLLGGGAARRRRMLLRAITPVLPTKFYAHLALDCVEVLQEAREFASNGIHLKLALRGRDAVDAVDTSGVSALGEADHAAILQLYAEAYPENWFDARMLATGQYVGAYDNKRLVAIAGVHVYAPGRGIAALGNITTHPTRRGRGLGRKCVAALCQRLLHDCRHVGLNVKADNVAAIRLYEQLGFVRVGEYEEGLATPRITAGERP